MPLKLEAGDPQGFIGTIQAVKGRLDSLAEAVSDIYRVVAEKLGHKARLQGALVTAFLESPDFTETKRRFDRLAGVFCRTMKLTGSCWDLRKIRSSTEQGTW